MTPRGVSTPDRTSLISHHLMSLHQACLKIAPLSQSLSFVARHRRRLPQA